MDQISFIYVTCGSLEESKRIGKEIVTQRLAACANIFSGMETIYWWEGELEEGQESVLILKTSTSLVENVIQAVCQLHSYEVPCIVSLPVNQGNPDYLTWIHSEINTRK